MGDRTNCTLIVFGETTKVQFGELTELIDAEIHDSPETWEFEEVNYAQLDPEVEEAIRKAGLSYIWLYENGCEYQSGAGLYDAFTGEYAEFQRSDIDLMTRVRDTQGSRNLWWQEFLDKGLRAEVRFTS